MLTHGRRSGGYVAQRCVSRARVSKGFATEAKKDAPGPPPAGIPYDKFVLGVPKESFPGELRVATTPSVVAKYVKAGLKVVVEKGAGEGASISDALYVAAGAKVDVRDAVFSQDMVFKVRSCFCPMIVTCCLQPTACSILKLVIG